MATYTTAMLAVKCSKSERQMQRLIKSGKLEARRIDESNRYDVSDEALLPFLPHEATDHLLDRIEASESLLMQLSDRVLEISQRLSEIEALVSEKPQYTSPARPRTAMRIPHAQIDIVESETPAPPDVPQGSVQFYEFARQHGINRRTFLDQMHRGQVHFIERPSRSRPGTVERWLRVEDQASAIHFWQDNGTRYTPCPGCPHNIM